MNPEALAARASKSGFHLLLDVRHSRCGAERREPVDQRNDLVVLCARLHDARPAHHHRNTEAAFPCRSLLAVKRRHGAVGPESEFGTIVRCIENDGIVRDTEVVELLEKLTYHSVMLDHSVGVYSFAGLA